MRRPIHIALVVLAAMLVSSVGVQAASDDALPPCDDFVLMGGEFEVAVTDDPPEGDSIGDHRYGERELLESDGDVVGMLRFVGVIVDVSEDLDGLTTYHVRNVYTLPNGTLHASGELVSSNATDPRTQPSDQNFIAIIGGTGAYLLSEGQVIATFQPDSPSRYEFDLHCD